MNFTCCYSATLAQRARGGIPPSITARRGFGASLIERARTAERGGFDALFFADGLNFGPPATWAYKTTEDFEPLTTAAALSTVTERIGFVLTGSATLQHPYHLARQFLSLDHLSGGRTGWNLVTSFAAAAADNFSARGVVDHDERYRIAEEAIDVVAKLWDGWGEDTIVADRPRESTTTSPRFTSQTTTAATSTSPARSARPAHHRAGR